VLYGFTVSHVGDIADHRFVGSIITTAFILFTNTSPSLALHSPFTRRTMAQSLSVASSSQVSVKSAPKPIRTPNPTARPQSLAGPSHYSASVRTGHLNLDTFSPVNEHGSFEFDRVLKRGKVFGKIKSRHVSFRSDQSLAGCRTYITCVSIRTGIQSVVETLLPSSPAEPGFRLQG